MTRSPSSDQTALIAARIVGKFMSADPNHRLLTFSQAAEFLGVGYHKIQRAAKRGDLRVRYVGDSRPYVTLADLLELTERQPPRKRSPN